MKKSIFSIGLLTLGVISIKSQTLAYVGKTAEVYVKPGTLVYSGGTVEVKDTGVIENQGDIMIDKGGFLTDATDGSAVKLKLNDTSTYASYGQLWINNTDQSTITGYLTKEYAAPNEGAYQHIALPFENKLIHSLSNELVKNFTDKRWSLNEILVSNNSMVRTDVVGLTQKTNDMQTLSGNYKTAYYSLGNYGSTVYYHNMKNIVGVPFSSDGVDVTLSGAGATIDFGTDGGKLNAWREKYSSYVRDAFASTDGKNWTNGYGKNLYQLGNPFLTNLDLSKIPDDAKAKIRGIRIELAGTTYDSTNGTKYGTYKYVTFSGTGGPVGDVSAAIVKPMQTFLIKTNDNNGVSINFASLRTFSNTPSNTSNLTVQSLNTPKSGLKTLSSSNTTLSSSSIKQLGLIALDENRNEIGRTYYVVYPEAITGKPSGQATTQAQATRNDVIGTFEEKAEGGYDAEAAKSYWLYINDANENDFKGKNILLKKNNADVKFLKFEIRENTNLLNEGESKLLSGESFYIESMSGGDLVKATHGEVIPATENYYNLYYGLPENRTLETIEVSRPADCAIVYDEAIKSYKLIFDSTWSSANIKVFDISGKLIGSDNGVSTSQPYSIYLPTGVQSTYVVVAQSEKGELFSQKIVTKN
ncbi:T9SS C-terminal target domain-containing protein [Riemerella anatipestifer]|nr:T9SS C-terminal target domain-containing protein [Riemerella anatipestifer]MDY3325366.1 T9SS C-terminal target domain-containing protein [Riemerella anatipestifer]MDY3352644.1 T9SS C-terminal target domain-containing protein [Riemerella anatipestifer]